MSLGILWLRSMCSSLWGFFFVVVLFPWHLFIYLFKYGILESPGMIQNASVASWRYVPPFFAYSNPECSQIIAIDIYTEYDSELYQISIFICSISLIVLC